MSEIIKCSSCRGQRNIRGLGMMTKKCPKCGGVGFTKLETPSKSKSKAKKSDEKTD